MTMTKLEAILKEQGRSKAQLSYDARVPASVISWICSGRFRPYRPQAERIAAALDFRGNPDELFERVPEPGTADVAG
jgi:hypothetical protein